MHYVDSGIARFADSGDWRLAVLCLHDDFHTFLYGLVPLTYAVIVFSLVCWWFYKVFVKSAFRND